MISEINEKLNLLARNSADNENSKLKQKLEHLNQQFMVQLMANKELEQEN